MIASFAFMIATHPAGATTVVAKTIITSSILIPKAMPAEIATELAAKRWRLLNSRERVLHRIGHSVFQAKLLDLTTQQPIRRCWDEKAAPLADCGLALRRLERQARRTARGALTHEMFKRMTWTSSAKTQSVLIWLPVVEAAPSKEKLLSDAATHAAWRKTREAIHTQARDALFLKAPWLKGIATTTPGAPALRAKLTEAQILQLAWLDEIANLGPFDLGKPASSDVYVDAVEGTSSLLTGNGVDVCLLEPQSATTPNNLTLAPDYCVSTQSAVHARCSAAMVRSSVYPYGVAPQATLHTANYIGCTNNPTQEDAINWCATNGRGIWNVGMTCTSAGNRLYDYWVRQYPYPLVVGPTGTGIPVSSICSGSGSCSNTPYESACQGLNMLVVGASDDCGTKIRADHRQYCGTRSTNPATKPGLELPHMVAPGYDLTADGWACGTGSSWSAALTSGGAAQLLESNAGLKGWPEAMRAILMCLADEDIYGGPIDLSDGVDDRDGVGELDLGSAARLAESAAKVNGGNLPVSLGHDYGTISSTTTPAGSQYSEVWHASIAGTGQRLRVILTWDGSVTCTNPLDMTTCHSATLDADLDLYIYANGQQVGASVSVDNSWEVVEIPVTSGQNYEIRVHAYSWTASSTYFGLAFQITPYSTN